MGGYLAVAYTDFFQSIVMLVGVMWIVMLSVSVSAPSLTTSSIT